MPSLDTVQLHQPDGFNILKDKTVLCGEESSLPHRRRRMHHHFEDLLACYTIARIDQLYLPEGADRPTDAGLHHRHVQQQLHRLLHLLVLLPQRHARLQ